MTVQAGSAHRLGAEWDGRGTNFALFSAHAEKVELCLFDRKGMRELERIALPERTNDVWHGHLADAAPGQLYGYRVHGAYQPEHGHRFNPNKLLVDPYARRLSGRVVWSDAMFGYRIGSQRADLSFDRRDSARGVPKSMVVDEAFTWGDERPPRVRWEDTIIYECHVKGVSMRREDVPPGWRGLFGGLAAPGLIDHLKSLGVTSVELLPVHAFVDDRRLADRGLRNFWGYNTLGFFAAEPRYGADEGADAFKMMVARLHDAGIEVLLDVVYNHTAEGDQLGPTLSFRGIDNASYYWLTPGNPRLYENHTGCGNALNLTHPSVLQMVMDSLRYWVEVCHVDGFRFDLGTTLARGAQGFERRSAFFAAISQDPVLRRVKLIAEPWDIGPGGYQVGGFPPEWSEWNDAYRRTLRRFWRGDAHQLGETARRMTASADIFNHHGRAPRASVNHVTVHDGFTLADVVSYTRKHNSANHEGNRDGANENESLNLGVEGPSKDAAITAARRVLRRSQLACLMLAQGVPILLAGDEVANSQSGNNNAYCQDNATGWVDWSNLGTAEDDHSALIGQLAALRRRYAQLRPRNWLRARDVRWLTARATDMAEHDWTQADTRFLAYILGPVEGAEGALLLVFNAGEAAMDYILPAWPGCARWTTVIATAPPSAEPHPPSFAPGETSTAAPRSVTVLAETK